MQRIIYNYLQYWKELSQEYKYKIFRSIIENDYRGTQLLSKEKTQVVEKAKGIIESGKDFKSVCSLSKKFIYDEYGRFEWTCEELSADNYEEVLFEIAREIYHHCKGNVFITGLLFNCYCCEYDILPMLHYVFDKWIICDYLITGRVQEVIDLSANYLYRMIPEAIEEKFIQMKQVQSKGAYCSIYLQDNKLYKVPKNLASKRIVNLAEWNTYQALKESEIKQFIPMYYDFDEEKGVLIKEYIKGQEGGCLLKNGELSSKHVEALEELYINLMRVSQRHNIKFDIHPDNFIWNDEKERWFFVDIGKIPLIGSDYYIEGNFGEYYKKSWLEREYRMKVYPIRSVLLYTSEKYV